MSLDSTGQGGRLGRVTMRMISYAPRSLPAGIEQAAVAVTVIPAGGGGSLLRADAEVIWFPPRSAAEYLRPAAFQAVTYPQNASATGRARPGRRSLPRRSSPGLPGC
jgi:hypothetical protein